MGRGGGIAARTPPPLLVLGAIASVQTGSAIARTLFDELGPAGVLVLRVGLSGTFLLALTRPRVRRWRRSQWLAAGLLGVAFAGMNGAFYLALRTVPLGVAVTVEFVGPLVLALVQTRRLRDAAWAALAMSGVALLGLAPGTHAAGASAGRVPLTGLALALLAGGFWAVYILASARVGRLLPGVDGLAVALLVATAIALPFGAGGAGRAFTDPALLAAGAAVALLSSVLSYGLELVALRRMPTQVFGILMSLEPAAAAVAGLLVLRQALTGPQVLALLLVSVASAGVTLGRGRPPAVADGAGYGKL